jgi:hypothetical protein
MQINTAVEWHLRLLIGLCSLLSYRLCNLTVALA